MHLNRRVRGCIFRFRYGWYLRSSMIPYRSSHGSSQMQFLGTLKWFQRSSMKWSVQMISESISMFRKIAFYTLYPIPYTLYPKSLQWHSVRPPLKKIYVLQVNEIYKTADTLSKHKNVLQDWKTQHCGVAPEMAAHANCGAWSKWHTQIRTANISVVKQERRKVDLFSKAVFRFAINMRDTRQTALAPSFEIAAPSSKIGSQKIQKPAAWNVIIHWHCVYW